MGFFIAMFICNISIPLVMIVAGYLMYKKPPKDINGFVGYRSTMSRKNKDTWFFAQEYCGRLWIKAGSAMLIPSIIVQLPFAESGDDAVGTITCILQPIEMAVMLITIIFAEKALRRTFDKNGNRR